MPRKSAVYGELVGSGNQMSVPVAVDRVRNRDKGGYAPERLDPILGTLVDNADRGAQLLEKYEPIMMMLHAKLVEYVEDISKAKDADTVHNMITATQFVELVDKVSGIVERVSKVMLSTVKAKDDATRLRHFLAGGDVEEDGLKDMGEVQLRKIIAEATAGWTPADGKGEQTP